MARNNLSLAQIAVAIEVATNDYYCVFQIQMKFTPSGGQVKINMLCEMQNQENRNKIISKVCVLLVVPIS